MNAHESRKLLVVDDQPVIHDAFRTVFAQPKETTAFGDLERSLFRGGEPERPPVTFNLHHAFQGEDGLSQVMAAVVEGAPFSVAFIDMRMPPGWDGLETIEKIMAADPLIQVVMCTAYSDYTWDEVLTRLGFTDRLLLLKKPFSTEEAFQLAVALSEKRHLLALAGRQVRELEDAYRRLEEEVSIRRSTQDQLLIAATHDALTQLPNRALFSDALRQACEKMTQRPAGSFDAIYFLDIDNFKLINDAYGHAAGDQLLCEIAQRLGSCHRRSDIPQSGAKDLPARMGGDEFVLLVHDVHSHAEVEAIAGRLIAALKSPFTIGGNELSATISIGVAPLLDGANTPQEALRRADIAMYQAKLAGKDQFAVFDLQMHHAVVRRLAIEAALCSAIDRDELSLVYQPILNSSTGELDCFEALLRWTHIELGEVSPGEFIPIAEESRMMAPIGEWVLRAACRQLAEWDSLGVLAESLRMSVNVSRKQLSRPDFIDIVKAIYAEYPNIVSRLNFEITESTVMSNPEVAVAMLDECRKLGIHIHMDDFGTGHSSLSCLHQFPIDVLKIDRSFVMSMETNADYEAVIHSIITLAHHLDVKVIAEGVESQTQAYSLRDLGCELVQGYYFSKPVASDVARELILDTQRSPSISPPRENMSMLVTTL